MHPTAPAHMCIRLGEGEAGPARRLAGTAAAASEALVGGKKSRIGSSLIITLSRT